MTVDLGSGFNDVFGSDQNTESQGVWFDVPNKPGWAILLRSQSSPEWRNFATVQQQRHAGLFAVGQVPSAEEIDKDRVEQLACVGAVSWRGFNDMPCTQANVRAVMQSYPQFRDWCMQRSVERSKYHKGQIAAIEKNSEPPAAPPTASAGA